jgi:hypothetical protein
MRKNTQSAADDDDTVDESFDGGRIEAMEPGASGKAAHLGAEDSATAPGWTKRLSVRDKLARALIVALAVLVALIVVLSQTTLPLPPQIARLLTPAPTRTPTPGQFTTGAFETVPLPVDPGGMPWLAPSLQDPTTAYVCASPPQLASPSGPVSGPITLWVTHTAGQSWSRAPLPAVRGTYCEVDTAQDGSARMTISVTDDALDQNAPPCAHSHYFLSEDDGATWRAIVRSALALAGYLDGFCSLWATARHLFMTSYFDNGQAQSASVLERSDDGSRTWQRADEGLPGGDAGGPAQPLDATGETLVTLAPTNSGEVITKADFWVTHDAGTHWQRVPSEPLPGPPFVVQSNMGMMTEPAPADPSRACQCVFLVYPYNVFNRRLYSSRDLAHWTAVPPIPAKSTSAKFSGVYATLGMTGDGRLLAVGPDPDADLSALLGINGPFTNAPPALWLWDTQTGRWAVAHTRLPCPSPLDCSGLHLDLTGVSIVSGASGQPPGTWFWISTGGGPWAGPYFRIFIPVA